MTTTNGDTAPFEGVPNTGALEVLERFRKPRPRPGERCELCATPVEVEHSHVVDVQNRNLMCSCRPCYLLFLPGGSGGRHYRAVPDRVIALSDAAVSRGDWEGMQIPVGVAFFFHSSLSGEVHAFYPGPAGATESLLPLDLWERLLETEPLLATLESDVEALLVQTGKEGDPAAFIVPIDACYELVGYLRMLWKGFDGGAEAHRTMDEFFAGIRHRAKPA